MDECLSMSTPMATERLDADVQGTPTDQMTYRQMVGGLMYLTASRPNISFATFVCARYQARPQRDHAECKDNCKSTSGGIQFLEEKLMIWNSKKHDCTAMSTVETEYVSLSACFIIMAQPQRLVDVHQDELCPPNKRYALMDANKKVDLDNPLCPDESIILANILQNHLLKFSIVASLSMPWIYLGKFWHTLKEDRSKYKLKFMLERKELTMTLDDFRTIFHLP
ncbi:hypothetical protein Tco_0676024 [Tanacetum coccineum]